MKRFLLFLLLLPLFTNTFAQKILSDQAEISILTSTPSDDAVFTIYGHTAIRVYDPATKTDLAFNYGIFDFSKSNFIYRFTKGETDYKLEAYPFEYYPIEYQLRGSGVREQVLNLTQDEIQTIWEALYINQLPENKVYRYNFFFDNCATRPVAIVEMYVDGEVVYHHPTQPQTFRQLINYSSRNQPWLTFGTDLALGSPTDHIATPHEEMFLPLYLEEAFANATIRTQDGTERKLVKETRILVEEDPEANPEGHGAFTPLLCSWLLFLIVISLTYLEWKKKKYYRWLDVVLFTIAGIGGMIIAFLVFVSTHPCTSPNWILLWLHPYQLAGAILFAVKRWNKAAYYYHFINFAALMVLLLGWYFIPQHFNAAFFPLITLFWIRSLAGIYRYKKGVK